MTVHISAGTDTAEMPLSPAVSVSTGRTIYLSGATPFPFIHSHPHVEEELQIPDDVYEQTVLALNNLEIATKAAGAKITDIVKVMVYNTRMSEHKAVSRAYQEFFGDHLPARTHIGVSALVEDTMYVEIDAIAVVSDRPLEKREYY